MRATVLRLLICGTQGFYIMPVEESNGYNIPVTVIVRYLLERVCAKDLGRNTNQPWYLPRYFSKENRIHVCCIVLGGFSLFIHNGNLTSQTWYIYS